METRDMTPEVRVKALKSIDGILLNNYVCCSVYDWSDEFVHSEVKNYYEKFKENAKELLTKEFLENLNTEQLRELGFRAFSDEEPSLWLIPLKYLEILPEGLKVESILGEDIVVGDGHVLDNDVRCGVTAYGIYPKMDA